jgi:hypothetical protein
MADADGLNESAGAAESPPAKVPTAASALAAPIVPQALSASPSASSRWGLFGIFLTFFSLYLLLMSRERPWHDATPVYMVAENLVLHGRITTEVAWPPGQPPAPDGKYRAMQPIVPSLIHVPGVLLREALVHLNDGKNRGVVKVLSWAWSSHLGPAAAGALACLLFFLLCRDRGLSVTAANLATVLLGAGSIVLVYARSPWTEMAQTTCFTGFMLYSLRALDDPAPRTGWKLGLWMALLLNTKLVYFLALPGPLLLIAWSHRREPQKLLRFAVSVAPPALAGIVLIGFYNWARFGSVLSTGYGVVSTSMVAPNGRIWVGLYSLLFSSGKSVFLYSPPLLFSVFALRRAFARLPLPMWLLTVGTVPVILLNANTSVWSGDWAWGPRYLTFLVPIGLFPAAVWLDDLILRGRRRLAAVAFSIGLLVGGAVQLIGSSFYWDSYIIMVSRHVKEQWLGHPNRGGQGTKARDGFCDPCVEDLYPLHYLPQFQPIVGHWWLLHHVPFGHDWKQADADAPWRSDTAIPMNIAASYARFRVDWWYLDYGNFRLVAWLLIALLTAIGGLGIWQWRARLSGGP